MALPPELETYLTELVRRLEALLGPQLAAVWCGGSVALGAYQHGRSDVDVVAVTSRPLERKHKDAVVAALQHEALPCPARKLEYVQYALDDLRVSPAEPSFDLEINDGATFPLTVAFGPDDKPAADGSFWYVLDRAQLRQTALALLGPPAAELLAPIEASVVLQALIASIRWHLTTPIALGDDAALNACRSLYWAETEVWTDKQTAGRRLLTEALPALQRRTVAAALAARTGGEAPTSDDVAELLNWCLARLGRARQLSDPRDA